MPMVSIGDLARSLLLQRHVTTARADIARLSDVLASGRHADQAAKDHGDLGPLIAIEGALSRLDAWQSAASGVASRLAVQQSALGAVHGMAGAMINTLIGLGAEPRDDQVDLAAAEARQQLDAATGVLNARFGADSVFAGTRTEGAAVLDGEALLDALWPAVAGATDAADARDRVLDWFDHPAGFSAQGYLGGDPRAAVAVGPGASGQTAVTADDPAIRRTLAGLAMAALLDRGLFSTDAPARRDLSRMAGASLTDSVDERVHLAAGIGLAEERVAQVQARNAAEITALGIARSGMVGADPFASAAELESARVQLELLYGVTARLSGMSLLGVLR